jgi:4-hydroxybenzoate polyprenyltransferase
MIKIIKLLRAKHWLKNTLVFVVPILNYRSLDADICTDLFFSFVAMSLTASCVYIFNDILDINDDRLHPVKKHRPLASGAVSIKVAILIAFLAFTGSLIITYALNGPVFFLISFYLILNVAYTLYLKKRRFLDIFCLAIFLFLRILLGVYVSGFEITNEFLLFIMLVLLSLSLKKRYKELISREVQPDERIRGYFGRDMDNLRILSKIAIFSAIGFYNMHLMVLPGFRDFIFPLVALSSLYMAFVMSEEDGPEDVVDLLSERRTLLPLMLNVVIVLLFL